MNNEQARPTSQPTPSAASGKEDYRRYIARKRRQRRTQRRLILCAAALLVLVLLIVLLVKGCSGSDPLTGTWEYDSNTTYQFDGKGSGTMMVHLGVLEDVDPIVMAVPSAGVFHINRALVLVVDFQSKGIDEVGQFHAVFHRLETACVRFPDTVLVVKPHLAFRYKTQAILIEIREDMPGSNVVPGILGGVHWVKFFQPFHAEVLCCGCGSNRLVGIGHSGERFGDREVAVGIRATEFVPLLTHQAGLLEQAVYLLSVPAALEGQR